MKKLLFILLVIIPILALAQKQPQAPQPAPDTQDQFAEFTFTGAWLPDVDPVLIGAENFKTLQNMRYNDTGVEQVLGYDNINTSIINATNYKIRSGVQFINSYTDTSYVVVQAENAGETSSKLYYNTTAITSKGNFESTALFSDTSGAGLGRFAVVKDSMIYANGIDTIIWGGTEIKPSAVFTIASTDPTDYPIDVTEDLINDLESAANGISNTVTFDVTSGRNDWLVMSSRPLQGVKYYIATANTVASTMSCQYWDGNQFQNVSSPSDGTDTGPALAQTGTFSFTDTTDLARPRYLNGLYLYTYMFTLTAGAGGAAPVIYKISVDADEQHIKDLWDGVYRQPIQVFVYRDSASAVPNYTLSANQESDQYSQYWVDIEQMTTSDALFIGFEDRVTALDIKMIPEAHQTNSLSITVSYWDGDSYEAVSYSSDSTSAFTTDGIISWHTPMSGETNVEKIREERGVVGYFYKITFSGTTSGTYGDATEMETAIDTIRGIPAPVPMDAFQFVSTFKNRVLLCNNQATLEENRVDFSMANAPDVWNGADTSNGGYQSLYFGGSDALLAGTFLYNRMGSNVYEFWVGLKANETYLLTGDAPTDEGGLDPFTIKLVSANTGIAAVKTLASAEVGFELAKDVERNVLMWLSYAGPVMFDGAVMSPIKGVDEYFDDDGVDDVNMDYIYNSLGWYDSKFKEYNLIVPYGSSQQTPNLWMVYSLKYRKWYTKHTGAADYPASAWPVKDSNGEKYVYAGMDDGYMNILENGNTWDGDYIQSIIETGDFFPAKTVWQETELREIKFFAKRIPDDHKVHAIWYKNTEDPSNMTGFFARWDSGKFQDSSSGRFAHNAYAAYPLYQSDTANRVLRTTSKVKGLRGWAHRLKFICTTYETTGGFQPLGFAIKFKTIREDD